jgi:dephospho-CoA kinase
VGREAERVHVVGLTGGIGSGKSSLAREFAALGVPVVEADMVARRCVGPGTVGLAAIVERFTSAVLLPDGSLDRPALAAIVFTDAAARRDLEAITHPCIREGIDAELARLRDAPLPPALVIVEHPLLVESGGNARVDRVVVVEAPVEQRVVRLVTGRGMDEADARARIAAQLDDVARRRVADHVVVNDGDIGTLRSEAQRLLSVLITGPDRRS